MTQQYIYNAIPGQTVYTEQTPLYEYQTEVNPLDPLGLQGASYTIVDNPKNYPTKSNNIMPLPITQNQMPINSGQNQAYPQQIQYGQINQNTNPQIYQNPGTHYQIGNYIHQNQNKTTQPIMQQQINQNNNKHHNIQQLLPPHQNIYPQPQKNNEYPQQINSHHQIQQQQIIQQKIPQQQIIQHRIPQQQIIQQKIPQQQIIQQRIPQQHIIQQKIPQQQIIQPKIPQQQIIQPQIQPKTLGQNIQFTNQQQQHQYQNFEQHLQPQSHVQQIANPQQQKINPQAKDKQYQPQMNLQLQQQNDKNIQILNKNQMNANNLNPQQKVEQQNNQQNSLPQAKLPQTNKVQNQHQQNLEKTPQHNQNPNLNQIKIDYKNNSHFVNQPIYDQRKPFTAPIVPPPINKQSKNPSKVVKPLENHKIIQNNKLPNSYNGLNSPAENMKNKRIDPKYLKPDMSEIKEEELDIKQSGLSKRISKINNSDVSKETPMEEKKPEEAFPFPENITEDKNQNDIIHQSVKSTTESTISDSKLDHMPTINSIMKGDSKPLPPPKNKYKK